jgi:RND family efflux transporter MFP subunit
MKAEAGRLSLTLHPSGTKRAGSAPFCRKAVLKPIVLLFLLLAPLSALAAGPPPANVVVTKVFEKEIAKTVRIMGMVDFDEKSRMAPEISGLVASQDMTEGALVKKETVLLRLSPDFIRKDIEIIQQQIRQAEIKISNAARNLKRLESLYRQKVTSQKDYDDLSDTLKELVVEKRTLVRTLEKKELELAKTVIRAPFDALVLERYKTVGEWVSRDTPICLLGSVSTTTVKAAISENLVRSSNRARASRWSSQR